VNDLDTELIDDTLNQLAIEDALTEEMGQLSLNAISGAENGDSMRIRELVNDKVMLVLIDSRSSHSFVNQSFVWQAGLQIMAITGIQVQVANGDKLKSNQCVLAL
jgi:hypothetical protein